MSNTSMGMTSQQRFTYNNGKSQLNSILELCPQEPLHSQGHSKLNVKSGLQTFVMRNIYRCQ